MKIKTKLKGLKFWRWNWRIWEWILLPKLVRNERKNSRKEHRANLKRLNRRGVGSREVYKIVERLKIEYPEIDLRVTISDSITALGGIIMFATVTDIADGIAVISEFCEAGFKKVGDTYQDADRRSLDWRLRKSNGKKSTDVSFRCFIRGETCKFVQVGVEEKPVMELRCGDEAVDLNDED